MQATAATSSSAGEQTGFLDTNQILMYLKRYDRNGCMEYVDFSIRRITASGEYTR